LFCFFFLILWERLDKIISGITGDINIKENIQKEGTERGPNSYWPFPIGHSSNKPHSRPKKERKKKEKKEKLGFEVIFYFMDQTTLSTLN